MASNSDRGRNRNHSRKIIHEKVIFSGAVPKSCASTQSVEANQQTGIAGPTIATAMRPPEAVKAPDTPGQAKPSHQPPPPSTPVSAAETQDDPGRQRDKGISTRQIQAVLDRSSAIRSATKHTRGLLEVAFAKRSALNDDALVVYSLTEPKPAKTFLRDLQQLTEDDPMGQAMSVFSLEPSERKRIWAALVATGCAEGEAPTGKDMDVSRSIAKAVDGSRAKFPPAIAAALKLL